MSKINAREKASAEIPIPENPDVVIVKNAQAAKLSPRGEGGVAYQVGRIGEEIFIRISENFGGGRHSKEWLPAAAIRDTMSKSMQRGEPFKSTAMTAAFKGKSQNNSGFLVAALRAEGLFAEDETHKGMSRLAGDFDSWEKAMREAAPILKEDGQPETAKLHPEPKETRFKPKQVDASNDAPQDDEKPKPRPVRVSKKVMDQLAAARAAESEAVSTDDNDAAEPIGGTEAAVG